MNDATKRVAEGWGFDLGEIEGTLREDVEVDVLSLLLLVDIDKRLQDLEASLERKVDKLVTDTSKLEAAINGLTGVEQTVIEKLNDLANEISTLEAGNVPQEKIDGLTAKVEEAVTALGNAVTPPAPPAEEPATPTEPPAEPTPEGGTPPAE